VADNDADVVTYEADFDVPPGFGEVGAVLVTNEHHTEMFLEDVNLYSSSAAAGSDSDSDSDSDNTDADGARAAPLLAIRCKSWVEPKSADANGDGKRVFFANKVQ
jgi:lipoxygenase